MEMLDNNSEFISDIVKRRKDIDDMILKERFITAERDKQDWIDHLNKIEKNLIAGGLDDIAKVIHIHIVSFESSINKEIWAAKRLTQLKECFVLLEQKFTDNTRVTNQDDQIQADNKTDSKKVKTILVADDANVIIRLVQKAFESPEYRVLSATDGERALNIALSLIPDVVLLDVLMPQMDGFEVAEKIRGKYKGDQIKIVMLTSQRYKDDIIRGFKIGINDYIVKPFNIRELRKRVEKLFV